MFVQKLTIDSVDGNIRDIDFHLGLNLIVDKTTSEKFDTGNNVGKTTALKLIDYCLGGRGDNVYSSEDGVTTERTPIETFLEDKQVLITLVLVDNLENPSKRVEIKRNFLKAEQLVLSINGEEYSTLDKFKEQLKRELLPSLADSSNSFREIISHNVRYDDYRLRSTLKTLHSASNDRYNELYLSLFNCDSALAIEKSLLRKKWKLEKSVAKRLSDEIDIEKVQSELQKTIEEIGNFESERSEVESSPALNRVKSQKLKIAEEARQLYEKIAELSLKIQFINESFSKASNKKFSCDFQLVKRLYQQATALIPQLQKSFEELTEFHNAMISKRRSFVQSELDMYMKMRADLEGRVERLQQKYKELDSSQSMRELKTKLDVLDNKIRELYLRRGGLETKIRESKKYEANAAQLRAQIKNHSLLATTTTVIDALKQELKCFNKFFTRLSAEVYNEVNELLADEHKGFYLGFKSSSDSAGKLQGEMFCFDLAYIKYADERNLDCLHFLLNDKKELVHGNQLSVMAQIMDTSNAQLIVSILSDKLPTSVRDNLSQYEVLSLSLSEKLLKF